MIFKFNEKWKFELIDFSRSAQKKGCVQSNNKININAFKNVDEFQIE